MITLTAAGQLTTTNRYDALGRLLSSTDAMGMTEHFAYDAAGRMTASKDRNGQITTYSYKPHTDYLATKQSGAESLSYTYDSFGNLLSAANNTGTTHYAYTFNHLTESITTPDNKTISYAYDANRNLTQVTDYSGAVINYAYDGMNRVNTVTRDNSLVADYDYTLSGTLERVSYPNQAVSEYAYDNALRLTSVVNKLPDQTVVNQYAYGYDLNGNQIQKSDNGAVTAYTYDPAGRLKTVTEPDNTQTVYVFDQQNNITKKTISHPAGHSFSFTQNATDHSLSALSEHVFTYAYDKNNRLKQETEFVAGTGESYTGRLEITKFLSYDNNGNLLEKKTGGQIDESVIQYSYTPWNQLSRFTAPDGTATEYAYAPDGMRASKTTAGNTTHFYWDREFISAEEENGSFTAKNYIGPGGVFARETASATSYLLKNGHGDVASLVSGGTVTNTYDYDAYGTGKNPDPNDTNPFRYCGEYLDSESGLIYLRNRYYEPSVGRFITEDPVRDGLNWYAYCGNNPVNYWDPWGLYYLEKDADGRIYAYIQKGDTLSGIALAEINDANAYTKMNYAGNPNTIEGGQRIEITGIYNENYPKENAAKNALIAAEFLPGYSKPKSIITFHANYGTGIAGHVNIAGVGVEFGGKRYYDMTTTFTDVPTESLQLSAEVELTNKLRLGASYTGTINAATKEHLKNEGYAGIKIGNNIYGFGGKSDNDWVFTVGIGAYLGIGGEIELSVNFSEIGRRYFD